jgi:hypothetical protein
LKHLPDLFGGFLSQAVSIDRVQDPRPDMFCVLSHKPELIGRGLEIAIESVKVLHIDGFIQLIKQIPIRLFGIFISPHDILLAYNYFFGVRSAVVSVRAIARPAKINMRLV